MGGQMVFMNTDLLKDEEIERAIAEAAKLGTLKYLANIAGIQHIDSIENFPMEKYDLMQKLMLRAPFLLSKLLKKHNFVDQPGFLDLYERKGIAQTC